MRDTTFIIFFGLVLLGLLHGLILLPVLLSIFGPLESIVDDGEDNNSKAMNREETGSELGLGDSVTCSAFVAFDLYILFDALRRRQFPQYQVSLSSPKGCR